MEWKSATMEEAYIKMAEEVLHIHVGHKKKKKQVMVKPGSLD